MVKGFRSYSRPFWVIMKHQLLCPIIHKRGPSRIFGDFELLHINYYFYYPNGREPFSRIIYDWNKGISPIMVDFKLWRRFHPFFIIRTIKRMQLINTHEIFLKMQKWVLKGSKFNSGWFWVIKKKIVLFISKLWEHFQRFKIEGNKGTSPLVILS